MLRFCPICKRWHNPESVCIDGTGSFLREAGFKPKPKLSEQEFNQLYKSARRILILLVLAFIAFFIAAHFILSYIRRIGYVPHRDTINIKLNN